MKYFFRHILIVVIFCFSSIYVFSQKKSQTEKELTKKKADIEAEITKIDKKLGETTKEKGKTTEQVKLLNQRIEQRKRLIANTDLQISITENEINRRSKTINELHSKIDKFKEAYSELLVNVYINRKKTTWLMYVFASEDLSQAYRRLKYLQSYGDVVQVQARKIEDASQNLARELVLLNDKKEELDIYKSEKKSELTQITKDEKEAKKILEGLRKEETKLKSELQKKHKIRDDLSKEIEKILTTEIAKDKSTGYTKTPEATKLSKDFAANRGHLPWPVKQGNIVGFFGNHPHPVFKHLKPPPNNGVDIETPIGENVLATFDGKVAKIFTVPGMNYCILLKHGNYFTLYCKLASYSVKIGDNVKTGTVLGKLVAENNDSQLHFELWDGTTKLNPQQWLAKK